MYICIAIWSYSYSDQYVQTCDIQLCYMSWPIPNKFIKNIYINVCYIKTVYNQLINTIGLIQNVLAELWKNEKTTNKNYRQMGLSFRTLTFIKALFIYSKTPVLESPILEYFCCRPKFLLHKSHRFWNTVKPR